MNALAIDLGQNEFDIHIKYKNINHQNWLTTILSSLMLIVSEVALSNDIKNILEVTSYFYKIKHINQNIYE